VPFELPPQQLSLALPASTRSAGFLVQDHQRVIEALSELSPPGMPERAVDKRRADFLAGRYAAQPALRELGSEELPARNDDGSPRWPGDVVGSITHGAGRALCVVARRSELRSIGIDTEGLMSEDSKVELYRRICTPRELAQLGELLSLAEHELVSLAFSAKESLYKCLYPEVGRFMDFHAASVVGADVAGAGAAGKLTLELAVDWSETFRAGQRFGALFHKSEQHVETAVLLSA
jgi:enterobactin synthetase component D